jgi:hypothetical protein
MESHAPDDELDADIHGTRAKGTDSLVYRVLRSPEHRTEEVLVRFLGAAIIPAPPMETIRKRARKLLAMIARHGDSAIPRNTIGDFNVSCGGVERGILVGT